MKYRLWLCIALFTAALATAQEFRTDINPALRYYQAFLEGSQIPEDIRQHLRTNEWRGRILDEKFGEAVSRYQYQFRLLREASQAKVPCDWGVDLSMGPESVLPALAPAKIAALTAGHRVLWFLQNGQQADARDDLLATYALARQISRDGVLISALVQIAIEHILVSNIAWNYFRWQPQTLREIVDGIERCPARGTIAQTVASERRVFLEWFLRRTERIETAARGNEKAAREELKVLLARFLNEPGSDSDYADTVLKVSGGTIPGVQKLIRELTGYYDRVEVILKLPHGPFEPEMERLQKEVAANSNPMISKFLTVFSRCRQKEFAAQAKLAMLGAALEYKLHGPDGLKRVPDPFGNGPFAFRRVSFQGEDRGFELRSAYTGSGFPEVQIFIEKDGPAFRLEGKNAGQSISN